MIKPAPRIVRDMTLVRFDSVTGHKVAYRIDPWEVSLRKWLDNRNARPDLLRTPRRARAWRFIGKGALFSSGVAAIGSDPYDAMQRIYAFLESERQAA